MLPLINQGCYAHQQFSQCKPANRLGRVINFPLVRVFIVVLFLLPLMLINSVVVLQIIEKLAEPLASQIDAVRMLITAPILIFSYYLYCKIVEKRSMLEIDFNYFFQEFSLGALVAIISVSLMVLLIALVGKFTILDFAHPALLLKNFINFSIGALLQELVLLCIVYRLLEEYFGTWIAIAISLLVFSFAHIINPNQHLLTVLMLTISSIIFIAPFILTRRIWLSWGFHALWNFMQAGVFGMPNSGVQFPGWINATIDGPLWLTGGSIGIEGSPLTVIVDTVIGLTILIVAYRGGKFVLPQWKR